MINEKQIGVNPIDVILENIENTHLYKLGFTDICEESLSDARLAICSENVVTKEEDCI